MNEQENLALVQRMYDAFGRGDIQTITNHLTDDVEWIAEGPSSVAYFGKMRGPAEVQSKFFGGIAATQENMRLAMEDFIAQGDGVAIFGRYSATVKATGKRFDAPLAHLFRIRDGKIWRFLNLGDTAAVAQAYDKSAVSSAA